MKVANLKIGTRLALGFGLLLALLLLLAGIAAVQMGRLADNANYYVINLAPSYEVEHQIALDLANVRRMEYLHNMLTTDAEKDAVEGNIVNSRKLIATNFERYAKDLVSDKTDEALLAQAKVAVDAYNAEWDEIRKASHKSLIDPAMKTVAEKLMLGQSRQKYENASKAINEWWKYNAKLSADQAAISNSTYASAKWMLAVLVAAALLLGIGVTFVTTRSITIPIQQAVEIASTVAKGDLSSQINVQGNDEIAQLLRSLVEMNDNLARIVAQIRSGSDTISTASSQIAAGNMDLSSRTEQQASSLEETASSMEEMTSTVQQNADHARQANNLANTASEVARKGGSVVSEVVDTMNSISESARKIVDIISVIDGIAFQTNILALNAAVEAARAGEQGRGFAVVASEVRNLAQRSASAAKEIKTLIGDSVEKVEAGSKLVDLAGTTMAEVVESVKRVNDVISEISSAGQEQTKGIEQINIAITEMDNVTQQNAALVEEAAAASGSLQDQAKNLTQIVSFFKIDWTHNITPTSIELSSPIQRASTVPARKVVHAIGAAQSKKVLKHVSKATVAANEDGTNDWATF